MQDDAFVAVHDSTPLSLLARSRDTLTEIDTDGGCGVVVTGVVGDVGVLGASPFPPVQLSAKSHTVAADPI